MRWTALTVLLMGSLLLSLPADAIARCSGSGPTFRCDPIISDSLRRKSQGLPPRYTPRTSKSYKHESYTYTTPRGSTLHRYKYKSPGRPDIQGDDQVLAWRFLQP